MFGSDLNDVERRIDDWQGSLEVRAARAVGLSTRLAAQSDEVAAEVGLADAAG